MSVDVLESIAYTISIHALRVEGDSPCHASHMRVTIISIHALRVEGDDVFNPEGLVRVISIHALRVEGDFEVSAKTTPQDTFLSTPSGWRATNTLFCKRRRRAISIHALRVEGDSKNGQNFRLFLRKRGKNLPF